MSRWGRITRPGRITGWMAAGFSVALLLDASASLAQDRSAGRDRDRAGRAGRVERRADEGSGRDSTSRQERRARRVEELRRALPDFTPLERRLLRREFRDMPKSERRALRERVLDIDHLGSAERSKLEAELRGMIDSRSDELHRLEDNVRRWQGMSDEERDGMRQQMRRFRELPLDERRELLDQWAPSKDSKGRSDKRDSRNKNNGKKKKRQNGRDRD